MLFAKRALSAIAGERYVDFKVQCNPAAYSWRAAFVTRAWPTKINDLASLLRPNPAI
jgi:hypothetical protein